MGFVNKWCDLLLVWLLYLCSILYPSTILIAQTPSHQNIDFQVNNLPVADALLQLSEAANISIAFSSKLFDRRQRVYLSIKKQSLEYILKACLEKTGIGFKIEKNGVFLFKKQVQKFTLSGYIKDIQNGERLISATIWDMRSGRGTSTNDYGFFSLVLPKGEAHLRFSYLGYQADSQYIDLKRHTKLMIELEPSFTLQEVVVTKKKSGKESRRLLVGGGTTILPVDFQRSPTLGGEADLFRHLQLQPGVESGADGLGGLHVRGGNADQNLVLFDGVPVFNPSHALGLFSVFNPHTIRSAKLLKDGFSAKYGGRLSSVLDIRSREGNTRNVVAEMEVSTLASKAIVEFPIVKQKSALLLSLRRTHIDPFVKNRSRRSKAKAGETGETSYFFYDVNAKFHTSVSKKDHLFLSFYRGKDDFENHTEWEFAYQDKYEDIYFFDLTDQQLDWGNTIAALRWNHLFGDKLFSNTTLTYSQYNYQSRNIWETFERMDQDSLEFNLFSTFQSKIRDFGLKVDFNYYPNNKHRIQFGGGVLLRKFEPGSIEFSVEEDSLSQEKAEDYMDAWFSSLNFTAKEFDIYVEDHVTLSNQFSLLFGWHGAAFISSRKTYWSWQPRLSFKWIPSSNFNSYFSVSRMTQFLHLLTTTGAGLPTDLWVPSTENTPPEHAWQISTGSTVNLGNGFHIEVSAYYKKMDGLISYLEGADLPGLLENNPLYWEEEITNGEGWSHGLELQIRKQKDKTTGGLAYTYARSFRAFEFINSGKKFPFRFERPHAFNIHLSHQLNDNISFHGSWQYSSGNPTTLVATSNRFFPLDNLFSIFSERRSTINGHRLPDYHRLDLNISFQWQKKQFRHFLNLGVYNAYDRKNPYFVYLLEDELFPEESGLKQQNSLPLLLSVGYRIRFSGAK